MKYISHIVTVVITFFMLLSCSSQLHVVPASKEDVLIENRGLIYFLPRTVIEITTEVITEHFIPGPYNSYAEKFLSIKDASSQKKSYSEISNIEIKQYFEADPNAAFLIFDTKANDYFFTESGILLGINIDSYKHEPYKYSTILNIPEYVNFKSLFPDMTTEENFTSIFDTTYRVIEIDSIIQKIPVYNPVMTIKTEEQKAEEAAEFIIEIRKSRFYLLQSDNKVYPDYGALKQMLKKLDEIEKKYLELFIGKTIKEKSSFTYRYTPKDRQKKDSVVMFYLCNDFGIVHKADELNYPVVMIFENIETSKQINKFLSKQTNIKEEKTGLFYRIPSNAIIYVGINEDYYAQKVLTIPQSGIITSIPEKLMKKNLSIKLHPEYGSIIKIK